jgi:hypothetical protein
MERGYQSADTLPAWAYGEENAGVGLLERAGIESPFPGEHPLRWPEDDDKRPYWLFASALDRFEGKEAREAFYGRL